MHGGGIGGGLVTTDCRGADERALLVRTQPSKKLGPSPYALVHQEPRSLLGFSREGG